jgi:tetratricopeptide (TPR) repeat protein
VVLLALLGDVVSAQVAPCTSPGCSTPSDQVWTSVQQVHERKQEFVVGVRDFSAALRGVFGDEASRVQASLTAMAVALSRWDDAIRAFETQARKVDRSADVHVALASVYLDRYRIDEALRELTAAAALAPSRADVYAMRAMAYGIAAKPADAASALARVVSLDASSLPAAYELWHYLRKTGEQEKAAQARGVLTRATAWTRADPGSTPFMRVALVRQVSGVAPIFPPGLYADGFGLLASGDYAGAVAKFKQAAARDPLTTISTAAQAGLTQASADLREGRLDAALVRLRALVQSFPDQSQVHRILGLAYWVDEQDNAGIEQFKEAIRLSPGDERSWLALADMLVTAGRVDDATATLERAIQALPDSGQARYSLGRLLQSVGRQSDALAHFEKAATPGPIVGHDALYAIVGGLHTSHANFDAAVETHARRIEIVPNSSDAHRQLGEAYLLQDRVDEAIAEFIVAAFLNPASAAAHVGASKAYMRANRYADAVTAARRALEIDPMLTETRYVLSSALTRAGQTEEGARELQLFQQQQEEATESRRRQYEADARTRDIASGVANGDYDKVVELLRGTIARDPKVAANHLELGTVLMKAGRYREALDSFEAARQLGSDAGIFRLLADAYRAMGRLPESQQLQAAYDGSLMGGKENRLRRMAGAIN